MEPDIELDIPLETIKVLFRNPNVEVKKQCLEYFLLMTAKPESFKEFFKDPELIGEIIAIVLLNKSNHTELTKLALDAITNVSSIQEGAITIFNVDIENEWKSKSVVELFKQALDKDNPFSGGISKVLANITIPENLSSLIAKTLMSQEDLLHFVFQAIRYKNYNKDCPELSKYMCQTVGNLTQSNEFQKYLISEDNGNLFCSMLSLLNIGDSVYQKLAVASAVYNCMFNSENHLVLLNPPFSILGYLLFPLAGSEEFDDDEVEKMPLEIQYLGDDKQREENPEVRKLLLKSLLMLCATKNGRLFLREHEVYLVLREYHKWEKDPSLILACENVVDILIRTEEEIGIDNLKILDVPADMQEKFDKLDEDFISTFDTNSASTA